MVDPTTSRRGRRRPRPGRGGSSSALLLAAILAAAVDPVRGGGNFCGRSWVDVMTSCQRDCPSGAPTECGSGETCFANTPCEVATSRPTPRPVALPAAPLQQAGPGNGGVGGTCGGGNKGNGRCPQLGDCCSEYGFCGTSADHCATAPVAAPQTQQASLSVSAGTKGTCGGGLTGNGICPTPSECCSQYGFCGTSADHCSNVAPVSAPKPKPGANGWDNNGAGNGSPPMAGTCGGGSTGNGICANGVECCSSFGFCGTSAEHCANRAPVTAAGQQAGGQQQYSPQQYNPQQTGAQPSQQTVKGTCGGGATGNGFCQVPDECCSVHGFCGTSLAHCTNRYDPNSVGVQAAQPQQTQQTYNPPPTQQQTYNPPPTQQTYNPPPTLPTFQQNFPQPPPTMGTAAGGAGNPPSTTVYYEDSHSGTVGGPYEARISYSKGPQSGVVGEVGGVPQVMPPRYPPVRPHGTNKKILGYYAGWQWYDRDKLADPANMDFTKVQRVNYAFFQSDVNGKIFGTDRWGDPQLLFGPYDQQGAGGGVQRCSYDGPNEVNCAYHEHNAGLINRAHSQGAEVYPSIGGWTLSDSFPVLSANPVSREAFARNCVEILTYHDFDGIDIDWEYPGYEAHSGTPQDKVNFTLMLAAIKAALDGLTRTTGRQYGLTAAMPCSPKNIANIEVDKIVPILTEFNLMSYDLHGSWDSVTGTNAPLYYQGFGNDQFTIHRCVENYVALGVPRHKINIGLPFYGRSFKQAKALNAEHGGNDLNNWPEDDGTPQFFNVWNKLPWMVQVRDNRSKTQYAYINHADQPPGSPANPDGMASRLPEGLVSFDDERAICDKVHYAQEKDLAGFIIWELSGDMLEGGQTPLLDVTNQKLADPALRCCMLHSARECELEAEEEKRRGNPYANMGMNGFDHTAWGSGPGEASGGVGGPPRPSRVLTLGLLAAAAARLAAR